MIVEVIDYSDVGNRLEAVVPHIGTMLTLFFIASSSKKVISIAPLYNSRSASSRAHFYHGRKLTLPGGLWSSSFVQLEQVTTDQQHPQHSG